MPEHARQPRSCTWSVGARSFAPAANELLEGITEIARTHAIDDRIDSRVAVAQPEADIEDDFWGAVGTEGPQQVDGEEGSPTENETTDDYSDRLRCFLLSVQTAQLWKQIRKLGQTRRCLRRLRGKNPLSTVEVTHDVPIG